MCVDSLGQAVRDRRQLRQGSRCDVVRGLRPVTR